MKNRGGEENCKVAANRLRKIRRAPAERIPLSPRRAHVIRPSNASFETKHRPPVAFQGSLSFRQRRLSRAILREKSPERELVRVPNALRTLQPAGRRRLVSIGREDGRRRLRFGLPKKSRIPGSARRFDVPFLLGQRRPGLMLQTLLPRPLPLSLRRIASCILNLIVQRSSLQPPPKLK